MSVLRTFRIKGNAHIKIKIKNNPLCEHFGGVSIWKVFCQEKTAHQLRHAVEKEGLSIEEYDLVLNLEQIEIKRRLLGLDQED